MRIEETTFSSRNRFDGRSYRRRLSPDTDVDTDTDTESSESEGPRVGTSMSYVSGILGRPGVPHPLLIISPDRTIRKRKRRTSQSSSGRPPAKQSRRKLSTSPVSSRQSSRSSIHLQLDSDSDSDLTDCLEVSFSIIRSERIARLSLTQGFMESQYEYDDMSDTPPLPPVSPLSRVSPLPPVPPPLTPFTPAPLPSATRTRSTQSVTASRSVKRRTEVPLRALHPALINARRLQVRRAREKERVLAENPDQEEYGTEPDVIELVDSSDDESDSSASTRLHSKHQPASSNLPDTDMLGDADPFNVSAEIIGDLASSQPIPPARPSVSKSTVPPKSNNIPPAETGTDVSLASSSSLILQEPRQISLSPTPDPLLETLKGRHVVFENPMTNDVALHDDGAHVPGKTKRTEDPLSKALRDLNVSPSRIGRNSQVNNSAARELEVPIFSEESEKEFGLSRTPVRPARHVRGDTQVGLSTDEMQSPPPMSALGEGAHVHEEADAGDLASAAKQTEADSLPTPTSLNDAWMNADRRDKSRAKLAASQDESEIPLTMYGEPALPDDEIVTSNPFGLIQPQMRHRQNQYTNWSSRVGPGTALDLLPDLDKYFDGGRCRWEMLWVEELRVTGMNHIPEKRLFVMVVWNRWKCEKGPISLAFPNLVPYLTGWLDKYWPILSRADVEQETRGHLSRMFNLSVITAPQAVEAINHLDKLAKADRRAKGELNEDDLWEEEQERLRLSL